MGKSYQRKHQPKSAQSNRSIHGQAIVEGSAMLVVMTTIVSALILLLINTYLMSTYNLRLQFIATDAARKVAAQKWWLGMQRPQYNAAQAESDARQSIDNELAAMGLPASTNCTFKYSFTYLRKKRTTIVRVDFDVTRIKIAKGLFFPSMLALHASGVSSDAEHAVTRHGQATIHLVDPSTGAQHGIRVPVYNATKGRDTFAHEKWLRAGKSAGPHPVAYLRAQCNTEGSDLNKQMLSPEGKTVITDHANWPAL